MFKRCSIYAYRCLLALYPSDFRKRFGAEMMEIAEAAEPSEWLLIFADTSLAILRSRLKLTTADRTIVCAGPVGYLALAESRLPAARLIQAVILLVAIMLAACYVDSLPWLWRFPDYPDCKGILTFRQNEQLRDACIPGLPAPVGRNHDHICSYELVRASSER